MVGDDVKGDDDTGNGECISHEFGGEAPIHEKKRDQHDLQKQQQHDEKPVAQECAEPFFLFLFGHSDRCHILIISYNI